MEQKEFESLVDKVGKDAGEKITSLFNEAKKGLITQEKFTEEIGKLELDAKSIRFGEGDKQKTLDDLMREMGGQIAEVKKQLGGDIALTSKDFKHQLESKMLKMDEIYKAKQGHLTLSLKAAAIMTTDNTIDDSAMPVDLIESFSMAAFAEKRQDRRYIFDIADRTTVQEIEQYKTWLEEGSEQGAFAIVAEGALKPLVSTSLVRNVSEARKIAGKYVVTEEFTKWRKNAYTIIRRLIMDKMMRDYEDLLTTGLIAAAAAYAGTALQDSIFQPNKYDAIGAVAAQIESLNFQPDTLILNPQDKWAMHLSKDNEGQYLSINIPSIDGETRLMSFRVRTSNKMPVGYFMLGEGGLWKIEDEAITVRVGYGIDVTGANPVTAVSSDFDNNRFRVIVETFFHDYIATPHIGSFVYGQFSVIQAAIDAGV